MALLALSSLLVHMLVQSAIYAGLSAEIESAILAVEALFAVILGVGSFLRAIQ